MPATRLCRTDEGKLMDGLKDLSELLESLGLEKGSVMFEVNGDICGNFSLESNNLEIKVEDDQKSETIRYWD